MRELFFSILKQNRSSFEVRPAWKTRGTCLTGPGAGGGGRAGPAAVRGLASPGFALGFSFACTRPHPTRSVKPLGEGDEFWPGVGGKGLAPRRRGAEVRWARRAHPRWLGRALSGRDRGSSLCCAGSAGPAAALGSGPPCLGPGSQGSRATDCLALPFAPSRGQGTSTAGSVSPSAPCHLSPYSG